MSRILVTGASGFIGRDLIAHLARSGHRVTAMSRSAPPYAVDPRIAWRIEAMRSEAPPPHDLLADHDAIIHLAGLAHSRMANSDHARAEIQAANVALPLALARQAAAAGVGRFLFVSSATVHGVTSGTTPFTESSPLQPDGLYAASKAEAETSLRALAQELGLDLVVVRPPLVYGPGVKANFARLMAWARRGYPMPSAALENRRSLIGLGNLSDFLALAATAEAAAGRSFLVSDGADLSTGELFRRLAAHSGRQARFLPLPKGLLLPTLGALGQSATAVRLFGSFQVDSSLARSLPWQARTDMREELARSPAGLPQLGTDP